jgi:hypothetical protein
VISNTWREEGALAEENETLSEKLSSLTISPFSQGQVSINKTQTNSIPEIKEN